MVSSEGFWSTNNAKLVDHCGTPEHRFCENSDWSTNPISGRPKGLRSNYRLSSGRPILSNWSTTVLVQKPVSVSIRLVDQSHFWSTKRIHMSFLFCVLVDHYCQAGRPLWTSRNLVSVRLSWSTNSIRLVDQSYGQILVKVLLVDHFEISGRPILYDHPSLNLGWSTNFRTGRPTLDFRLYGSKRLVDQWSFWSTTVDFLLDSNLSWSTNFHILVDQCQNMPYAFLSSCRLVDQLQQTGRPIPAQILSLPTVLMYRPTRFLHVSSSSATIMLRVVRRYI